MENINERNEVDLIKYFLILVKNFKIIIIIILAAILITFLYKSSNKAEYQTQVNVSENELLSFLLKSSTNRALSKYNYNPSIFLQMQNESFLNYQVFFNSYKDFNEEIKSKISVEELFSSINISNFNDKAINNYNYVINTELDQQTNEVILKALLINSQKSTFTNVLNELVQQKNSIDSEINLKRVKHIQEIDRKKKLLKYDAKKLQHLAKSIIKNEIDVLKDNLSIAEKMNYIDPIYNTNELIIQIEKEKSEAPSITDEDFELYNENKKNKTELLNQNNKYLYGSTILSQQIKILEKNIDKNVVKISPELAAEIEFIELQKKDEFIKNLDKLKDEHSALMYAINDLELTYSDRDNTAFITTFNLDRIKTKSMNRSDRLDYLIALFIGVLIGCIFVLINYTIKKRLADENEIELINISKSK